MSDKPQNSETPWLYVYNNAANYWPRDMNGKPVYRELVDDLANVLSSTVVGWSGVIGHDLAEAPEVKRVMARYQAYKAAKERQSQ